MYDVCDSLTCRHRITLDRLSYSINQFEFYKFVYRLVAKELKAIDKKVEFTRA